MSSLYAPCPDCGKLIRKNRSHIHTCIMKQDLVQKRSRDKNRGKRYVQFLADSSTKENINGS